METPVATSRPALIARAVPVIAGICVVLVLAGVGSYLVRGAPLRQLFDAWALQNAPVGLVGVVVFGLALRRQPANRAAAYFFAGGVLASVHVGAMALAYASADAVPGLWSGIAAGELRLSDLPGAVAWPMWIAVSVWVPAAGLPMTLGLLHFPDGSLPSPRWRPAVALSVAALVLAAGAWSWGTRPWSPDPVVHNFLPLDDPVVRVLFLVGMPVLGLAGMVTVGSLVVRMRAADPVGRRRIRPVVIVGSLVLVTMVGLYPWQPVWALVSAATVSLFLVTIAASVARHRLFDVELAVSRAVTVALLGLAVTGAYIGIVAVLGELLGAGSDLWSSVAATAVIAVGFEPVRRRVLAATTRLVVGARTTPYEVLAGLSDRLGRADSTEEVLDRVVTLLVEGTGAARAEVRSRQDGTARLAAAAGAAGPDAVMRSAAVVHAGELLGEVRLLADREDRFLPSDERLVEQVAATLGPVLRNARLTRELHDNIEELRASRQRIVSAHDEARRAVERDIHDGAQQRLLSLRLRLGLATTVAERDGADAVVEVLDGLAADADAAIRQLRELARGLYPPVLSEQGLATALRAHARDIPIPVAVDALAVGRYDRSVEATVYFCCLEALHNAAKHAGASALRIELVGGDGSLRFLVSDDGSGFDPADVVGGTGLRNMQDRVAGIGGTLAIDSGPGGGTVVRGLVPTAAASDDQLVVSDR